MEKFIRVNEIDKNLDFVNLAVTLKNVDAKSKDDMLTVCKEGNFNFKNLTSNVQIHSDIVNVVEKFDIGLKKDGDALITNLTNTPLLIFTADCVPIALIDKKNKAIGLIHAGWRGTYSKIVKNTIDKMIEKYNTNPKDIVSVIGPSIGRCCYEVSEELIEKFNTILTNKDEKFYIIKEGKYHLDLWNVNEQILKECDVKKENIINLNICTSCESDRFHSYRKHDKTNERIGMILEIK
ncbi:peptidoglycan editing factor PgeF [Romboutsia sp. 1001216sp1]|uniref:peptidoglycan editing factor PgeF n=1 Tax=Romboutsia sp. 1001216sp1 TaxID=2986997 RepID=UPI00232AA101|nr:peptidoglycan editing factor PgeF [Romboutsia sp. 1001216sp1]MDB8804614.1 peptidoglycan editing factor PgeF [Romboutsia sp. 1001216sp1]MDB8806462.1 peptidoglycan editing factor PgeF [Romboutsia sp. 1001216sp1]MDB8810262.1 peptidoglycan editing factor PgeF [Romboutsia sp. 1001216sp1]MDB8816009.1 peptidoglycan editing factor PgeF [Romboutsia sp. 1001216sp1]MDB8818459.1 peptidoglycan editing factor PgeF [Romboutsia sp. 1001216sp1]